MGRLRPPTLEGLFVATFGLLGVRIGAQPISDNSAFVHLRTGIEMARTGAIPRADPYSFTAAGHPWTVQSWLPELATGWAHRIAGGGGVLLVHAVLLGAAMLLVAQLGRTGSAARTALVATVCVGLGGSAWGPRPVVVAFICLAVLITAFERGWPAWLALPLGWVWVNSHGSFPLGLVWLALVVAGSLLDRERPVARRAIGLGAWLVGGVIVGAAAPLGFRALAFPSTVLARREVFQRVVEWRSPSFTGAALLSLVALVVAVVILARSDRRAWRDLLPLAVFVSMALVAERNLAMAGIVLAPVLARALRSAGTRDASDARRGAGAADASVRRGREARGVNAGFAGIIAIAAVLFVSSAASGPVLDERRYPVRAARWLEAAGHLDGDTRLAHQDTVGCWLLLTQRVPVFIDDRYDMYPVRLVRDYFDLLDGTGDSLAVLDRHEIDVVLWEQGASLPAILDASAGWRRRYGDGRWVVYVRA